MLKIILIIAGSFICFSLKPLTAQGNAGKFTETISPETEELNESEYARLIYVSVETGSDAAGYGTKEKPFKTISYAINNSGESSAKSNTAVLVASGIYDSATITLKPGFHLLGGFNKDNWQREILKNKTILSGGKNRRILTAADNCKVDGFTFENGQVRGEGAAIYCDGVSLVISNNIFQNNKTLKPDPWNPKFIHENANDGGAIYGTNKAAPIIENNYFIQNYTENGRGGAVAFENYCNPVIRNNVFYKNISGLDDPMRSSDGGAVSLFNWCGGVIENNIFLSNRADSKNDGGGVFVALWSSPKINNNIFVDNECSDDAGALFVGGQEHRYDKPLDPIPPADKFYVSIHNNLFIGNRNSSMNSGVMRFTMESRGEFINNITAHNNGIYFQRSETKIYGNIILDKFLHIETKEGLKKGRIEKNIIWADFEKDDAPVDIVQNIMLDSVDKNPDKIPEFADDGCILQIYSANYFRQHDHTELLATGIEKSDLVNRVVKTGDKWSVIKSVSGNVITTWGDLSGTTILTVLPSYTLSNNLNFRGN